MKARVTDIEFLRQFEEVQKLADIDKMLIKQIFDAFITKKKPELLAAG